MIWATSTPAYRPELEKPKHQWEILEDAEVKEYNAAALEIVHHEGLAVNDLHDVIMQNDFAKCLRDDGVHMTEFGNEVLSDAVVKAICEHA